MQCCSPPTHPLLISVCQQCSRNNDQTKLLFVKLELVRFTPKLLFNSANSRRISSSVKWLESFSRKSSSSRGWCRSQWGCTPRSGWWRWPWRWLSSWSLWKSPSIVGTWKFRIFRSQDCRLPRTLGHAGCGPPPNRPCLRSWTDWSWFRSPQAKRRPKCLSFFSFWCRLQGPSRTWSRQCWWKGNQVLILKLMKPTQELCQKSGE